MKTVTIEGDTWHAHLTEDEFQQWSIYAERHELLMGRIGYRPLLEMFLNHFRRAINLNEPLKP